MLEKQDKTPDGKESMGQSLLEEAQNVCWLLPKGATYTIGNRQVCIKKGSRTAVAGQIGGEIEITSNGHTITVDDHSIKLDGSSFWLRIDEDKEPFLVAAKIVREVLVGLQPEVRKRQEATIKVGQGKELEQLKKLLEM